MSIGFTFNDSSGYTSDIDDYLVRREYFSRGGLWTWGYNLYGQLGDNTITDRSSPGSIIGGDSFSTWKEIGIGGHHTAAIKTDGTLWIWGFNGQGQLGLNDIIYRSTPVQVTGGGTNWKQVSCGQYSTAAIKTDGTLWLWGYNTFGQLGLNHRIGRSTPVQVTGGGTNWKQVASGQFHTVAIKTDGTLWTWGFNGDGQLGDNTVVTKSSPVQVTGGGTNWKQVSCGYYHTAAIKTDGTLWTWGYNGNGQLGRNTISSYSSPVPTIEGFNNWKSISMGWSHSAGIVDDSL